MATCLCMRGASTLFSTIRTNIKSSIYRSKFYSVPLGFLCVISDKLTSGIHSCIHTMGSRSSAPPIHTLHQPSPVASMNDIYSGSPGISYVHLVGSTDASCSSCCIPFTDCLIAVIFLGLTLMVLF